MPDLKSWSLDYNDELISPSLESRRVCHIERGEPEVMHKQNKSTAEEINVRSESVNSHGDW